VSVAPLALPEPHGESSVPNLGADGAVVVVCPPLGAVDAVGAALPWFPPHAAATSPITTNTVAHRAREFIESFRDNMRPPGHGEFRLNLNTSLYIRKQRLASRYDGC
jgi:hypothetical protein